MQADIINILLGFVEGLALSISPCILPILPIILVGSLSGSKKRPIGIVLGFVLSFALFTFFARKLVLLSGVDLNLVRYVSYGILMLFGVIMLSEFLSERFSRFTQGLATVGSNVSSIN
ncbi:MAG: cytochrome c biogenesis protein DipZ, partial [Pseudomonadota bacterium]|nr:cytochrome c biogenesis protein DipZ [Pseudomonadota bacterium]